MRKQYWFSFIAAALVAGCAHTGKIDNYRSTQHPNQAFPPYTEDSNPQQDRRSYAVTVRPSLHSTRRVLQVDNPVELEGGAPGVSFFTTIKTCTRASSPTVYRRGQPLNHGTNSLGRTGYFPIRRPRAVYHRAVLLVAIDNRGTYFVTSL